MEKNEFIRKKNEALELAARIMRGNGLSIPEMIEYLKSFAPEDLFDLAVKDDDGKIIRVPFAMHDSFDRNQIIGIYTDKTNDCALSLEENPYIHGTKTNWQKLPSESFMRHLASIKPAVDKALAELNATPLIGNYHTAPDGKSGLLCHMVSCFADDKPFDAWSTSRAVPAKYRYMIKS